jgi:hypothetical protein
MTVPTTLRAAIGAKPLIILSISGVLIAANYSKGIWE